MARAASDTVLEQEVEAAPKKRKLSGRTLVLFIVLPILLLMGGGAGAAYFLGLFGTKEPAVEEAKPKVEKPKVSIFFDLPEILVNLNSSGRQVTYMKLRIALELSDPEHVKALEKLLPRVLDNVQLYLREMRPEELTGSAGLFRLKEELLVRVNTAVAPVQVSNVLFKEMLLQ